MLLWVQTPSSLGHMYYHYDFDLHVNIVVSLCQELGKDSLIQFRSRSFCTKTVWSVVGCCVYITYIFGYFPVQCTAELQIHNNRNKKKDYWKSSWFTFCDKILDGVSNLKQFLWASETGKNKLLSSQTLCHNAVTEIAGLEITGLV